MSRRDAGFSLVEVLVAIVILSIGLLALAQSSGAVTTMIGRSQQDSEAAATAQARIESLRLTANSTTPKCTSLASGSATGPAAGTTTAWTVSGTGASRTVVVTVTYRIGGGRGTRTETIQTILGCL